MENKANNPFVSVIVPVYKPGVLFNRCLASLLSQSLRNIEIIFVDDCGDDGTIQIVQDAALRDNRIRILHNDRNLGPGISRNKGIDIATGEYIAFLDADDFINPNFYELLYDKCENKKEKIIRGTFVEVDENGIITNAESDEAILNSINRSIDFGEPLYSSFVAPCWCAIYHRSWIVGNNIRFGRMHYSEDSIFMLKACHCAKAVTIEREAVYYYVQSGTSLMHKLSEKRLTNLLQALTEQYDYILQEVKSDELSLDYVMSRVTNLLPIQAAAACRPDLNEAAKEFLLGLKVQTERLPCLDDIIRKSVEIRVLVQFEANISVSVRWFDNMECLYLNAVNRVFSFINSYPELEELYDLPAKYSILNAIEYNERTTNKLKEKIFFRKKLKSSIIWTDGNGCLNRHNRYFIYYYGWAQIHAVGRRIKRKTGMV